MKHDQTDSGIPHWQTTTFVGALTLSGIIAPMTLPAAMSGAAFTALSGFRWNGTMTNKRKPLKTLNLGQFLVDQVIPFGREAPWVEGCLAPVLSPGDIVVLDNLPAHKTAPARLAIEVKGARLVFLPPYSHDFNPIELALSKIKALLKRAAARTVEDLWLAIRESIDAITPNDDAACSRACGYEPE